MRRVIMAAMIAIPFLVGLVSGAPLAARADDIGGSLISMQRAVLIANGIGLVRVNEIQFDDGKWNIEGRDPYGRSITIDVNARTEEVLRVDRW